MTEELGFDAIEPHEAVGSGGDESSTRRDLLRKGALAVGVGVAAVGLSSKPAAAANGDPLTVGQGTTATASTVLQSTTSDNALVVINDGTGNAVAGLADDAGAAGVVGGNSASTGDAHGVIGESTDSPTGIGVEGRSGYRGVVGKADSCGVWGESDQTGVTGRAGVGVTTFSTGVVGECYSPTGHGVRGAATGGPGSTSIGVQGTTDSADGVGVYGEAFVGAGTGVEGKSIEGIAVKGESTNAFGVQGRGQFGVVGFGVAPDPSDQSGGVAAVASDPDTKMALLALGRVAVSNDDDVEPVAPVHVFQENAGTSVELLMQLESDTNPQQTFVNNTTNDKWFFAMTADGQFKISKAGTGTVEAKFFDNGDLTLAGSLNQASDVNIKHDIAVVDPDDVLEKLAAMPVSTWKYNADPDVTHLGPTAQDFAAAFGLGKNDTTIAAVDADGVALAAIQALHAQNQQLQANQARLEAQVAELMARHDS